MKPKPLFVAVLAAMLVGSACSQGAQQDLSRNQASVNEGRVQDQGQGRAQGQDQAQSHADSLTPNATIVEVVDGDTVIAQINGVPETIRLIGIDTPESVARDRPVQCYGPEASKYLLALLPEGIEATLFLDQQERDRYDRLLAYIFRSTDGLFVNLNLVQLGFADTFSLAPNTHYKNVFAEAQAEAQAANKGLWGVCGGPDVPLELPLG